MEIQAILSRKNLTPCEIKKDGQAKTQFNLTVCDVRQLNHNCSCISSHIRNILFLYLSMESFN